MTFNFPPHLKQLLNVFTANDVTIIITCVVVADTTQSSIACTILCNSLIFTQLSLNKYTLQNQTRKWGICLVRSTNQKHDKSFVQTLSSLEC